jgi:hypothetical protein
MKIEQNIMTFGTDAATAGYIDLPRALSAVNGKSITQTKRSDGKYKPLGYMIRLRALQGNWVIKTLNCGYPTRNAVVLAGAARDAMLKSAGVSRSNLESYQKELRLLMDGTMKADKTNMYFPGGVEIGDTGMGASLTYDYTKLQIVDPDGTGAPLSKYLRVLGTQDDNDDNWDDDTGFYVIDNWKRFRHSFTPAAATDDIANNVFSWAMQQSDTAATIIDNIEDEADEKPYDLSEFATATEFVAVGTDVGNPISTVICAPLGLLKVEPLAPASGTISQLQIEVVGVTEL